MIKKIYKLFILLFIPISILGQPNEVSISIGGDFYKIKNLSTGFELVDLTEAKIVREGFSNPLSLGIGGSYSFTNKYILSLEIEMNYLEYKVDYTRNYPRLTNPFYIKTSNYEIPWARLSTFINIDYVISSIEEIDFLIGGGIGIEIFTPAVSVRFLYDTLLNKLSELDISDDISLGIFFSQKVRAGVKYKIKNSNFNISVFSRYNFIYRTVYEAPPNYLAIKINLGYEFK